MAQKDAWRAYYELALGLTETSRKQAAKIAERVASRGGATAEQLQQLAEDFINAGLANREAMTRMVRVEIDRALGRVGLATMDEVEELTKRIRDLERELRVSEGVTEPEAATTHHVVAEEPVTPVKTSAKKAVAKKSVAKKTVAKKAKAAPAADASAKAVPGTSAAIKTRAVKTAAAKTAPTQAPAAKTAQAKTTPTKTTPAKTAGTKSTGAAKKTTAKKAVTTAKKSGTSS